MNLEFKNIPLELKDVDKASRTAVIAHAAYDNIDRTNDISRKGMFNKSWSENKSDISFYLNHDDTQAPGKVVNVFEDDKKAYTEAKLGTHTLGNDTLIMMDEGVIKNASFGYYTVNSKPLDVKGKKVRELTEVKHIETSVLTKMPANPKAGVVSVVKSFDLKQLSTDEMNFLQSVIGAGQSNILAAIQLAQTLDTDDDLFMFINYYICQAADQLGSLTSRLYYGQPPDNNGDESGEYGMSSFTAERVAEIKKYIKTLEKFIRDTKASDECIASITEEIKHAKSILSGYDTAGTRKINEPPVSVGDDELKMALAILDLKLKVA